MSPAAGALAQATPTPAPDPDGVPTGLFPDWMPEVAVDLLAALIVLAIAYVVSRLLVRLFGRRISEHFRRPSLTQAALRGIRLIVFVFALLPILRIFGLRLSDIAISVGIFTAVVGVVIAPIVGSIISGVFLLADQPYEIGDMVRIVDTDRTGFVEDITLRYTKIFTLDNTFLVIPNGEIRKRDVINYSAEDARTRLAESILVTYESDISAARDLIESAARQVDVVIEGGPNIRVGAARYPAAPTCYIDEYADHGVKLTLRYWVREPYRLLATRSAILTNVESAIDDADVEIAYPHSHLVFDDTSGHLRVSGVEDADSTPSSGLTGQRAGGAVEGPAVDEGPVTETDADGS